MASSLGALIGPLFDSVTPKGQDKKRARKPKSSKAKHGGMNSSVTKGEASVTEPFQQHGELANSAAPKPLSEHAMVKEHARRAKVNATQDWVDGRITKKEHEAVHKRANHVLTNRRPEHFKGTQGERSMRALRIR